jgi:pimeloyl-ACP methyl ester carboxylesterase
MHIWLSVTGVVFVAVLAAMTLRQRLHRRLRQELSPSREPVTELPDLGHLDCQTVRFATQRGRMLEGWWLAGEEAQGHVILTHGWGANRRALLPLAPTLVAAGWNVLLFDVRNHGNSDEDSFASMPRFAEDIDAAIAWLNDTQGQYPIALIGHSVGAAATLLAASRRNDIAAVVSLSSFAHPADMMKRWLAEKGIPFFPLGWYVLRYVEGVIGHPFDRIAPLESITRIHCSVLLVHGDSDTTIPIDDAYLLASKTDNALLRVVAGGHDLTSSIIEHGDELIDFLQTSRRCDARQSQDKQNLTSSSKNKTLFETN